MFESVCVFLNRQGGHLILGAGNDGTPTLSYSFDEAREVPGPPSQEGEALVNTPE